MEWAISYINGSSILEIAGRVRFGIEFSSSEITFDKQLKTDTYLHCDIL